MAKETYTLKVAGLTRELEIFPISDELSIAALIMLGDVEFAVACAKALLEKVPDFDVILTPEAKSIPLAHEMARQSGKPYMVARKSVKLYMRDPVSVRVKTITTEKAQMLYLSRGDVAMMDGRRVLLLDDVASTGGAMRAMEELAAFSTGTVAARAAVLAEGDSAKREDLIYLAPLPLIRNKP